MAQLQLSSRDNVSTSIALLVPATSSTTIYMFHGLRNIDHGKYPNSNLYSIEMARSHGGTEPITFEHIVFIIFFTSCSGWCLSPQWASTELDHIAYSAKWCRQAFLDGNISWGSEEETALADERDRKEPAKLGSQGWAHLRGFRGK